MIARLFCRLLGHTRPVQRFANGGDGCLLFAGQCRRCGVVLSAYRFSAPADPVSPVRMGGEG